jgi:hypothetical protein
MGLILVLVLLLLLFGGGIYVSNLVFILLVAVLVGTIVNYSAYGPRWWR